MNKLEHTRRWAPMQRSANRHQKSSQGTNRRASAGAIRALSQPGQLLPSTNRAQNVSSLRPATPRCVNCSYNRSICSALFSRNDLYISSELTEMLTNVKQSLDKELTGIDSHMENFEVQQKLLEEELKDFKSLGQRIPKNQERIVPPALVVITCTHFSVYCTWSLLTYLHRVKCIRRSQVRRIHNSLDEEKQFKVNEPCEWAVWCMCCSICICTNTG